eukprot:7334499-Prymnesium_polylepis.2
MTIQTCGQHAQAAAALRHSKVDTPDVHLPPGLCSPYRRGIRSSSRSCCPAGQCGFPRATSCRQAFETD